MSQELTKEALEGALRAVGPDLWVEGGAGREALRKELATRRSWGFPLRADIPVDEFFEQGIMQMLEYEDYLYAFQNNAGVIWRFDGSDWTVAHEVPAPDVLTNHLRGICYGSAIFKGRLQMGHYQFDGTTWRSITGLPTNSSINNFAVFRLGGGPERLYAVVYALPQVRTLYVSDDGLSFTPLWTAPAGEADFLRGMDTYWGKLYIGGSRAAGSAPVYSYDGTTFTNVYAPADEAELIPYAISGRLFAIGYRIHVWANPASPYLPTTWTNLGYTLRGMTFRTCLWRGATVYACGGGQIFGLISNFYNQFRAIPFMQTGCTPNCSAVYKGKLYIAHETPVGPEAGGAQVWEFDDSLPCQPVPVQYLLWTPKTVAPAGERTDALPTVGGPKTFYLLSTVGGTVKIEVDIGGRGLGTYQTFDTSLVVANTLWRYTTLDEFAWARLFFTPTAPATVQAWLSVVPD